VYALTWHGRRGALSHRPSGAAHRHDHRRSSSDRVAPGSISVTDTLYCSPLRMIVCLIQGLSLEPPLSVLRLAGDRGETMTAPGIPASPTTLRGDGPEAKLRSLAEAGRRAIRRGGIGRRRPGISCRVAKFGFGYESARLLDIARRVQSAAIETDSQIARAHGLGVNRRLCYEA
jgi:hypothetical protein